MKTKLLTILAVATMVLAMACASQASRVYSGSIRGAKIDGGYEENSVGAIVRFDMHSTAYIINAWVCPGGDVSFRITDIFGANVGENGWQGVVTTDDGNHMVSRIAAGAAIGPYSKTSSIGSVKGWSWAPNPARASNGADFQGYVGVLLYDESHNTQYGWVDRFYAYGSGLWSVNGQAY